MVLAIICTAAILAALLSCMVLAWYLDGEEVTASGECPPRAGTIPAPIDPATPAAYGEKRVVGGTVPLP